MNNQKGKMNYYNKHQDYSLLEIIVVLAVIGAVMATWLRKRADETARQTVVDALAQEVYGVLRFIHSDTLFAAVNKPDTKTRQPPVPVTGRPGVWG